MIDSHFDINSQRHAELASQQLFTLKIIYYLLQVFRITLQNRNLLISRISIYYLITI
ncbi:unnamed protein product [Paramecium octaurelia]|uniref:Uncharacterized protein n=1 Tax=Paramecium octaurelia TaxID=43137 RepID=A0A8S1Y6G5_PAROT|nr:unnamed protein product [Paramecium octaurelia]